MSLHFPDRCYKVLANFLYAVFAISCLISISYAAEAKRLALVIGNDNYQHIGKLEKAGNDATAMARELKTAGFQVELHRDVNYRTMSRVIDAFASRINGGDQVVVFYAGHGVQIKSGNYLLPTDLEKGSENEIERFAYSLDDLTAKLSEAKASFSLVLVDACRNNPIKVAGRSIGASRGLSPVEPPKGQMVVFSASRGQEALDKLSDKDNNPNGVFTREFIARMKKPGVKIQDLMVDVQDAVENLAKSVGHEQRPALYNESRGVFYFYGDSKPNVTVNNNALLTDAETDLWRAVEYSGKSEDYTVYLQQYPTGKYVALAKMRLQKISDQTVQPSVNLELNEWTIAQSSNTEAGYLSYLKNYPAGQFTAAAKSRLENIRNKLLIQERQSVVDYDQAMVYFNAKNYPEAVRFYNQSAEYGYVKAQYAMGYMYDNGFGVKQDKKEMMRYYLMSASQGLAEAQDAIGYKYLFGDGVGLNHAEAMRYFRLAAAQGYAQGQYNLGYMHLNGLGVATDKKEAVRLYRLAADQGYVNAQDGLGYLYGAGEGVRQNNVVAYALNKLANTPNSLNNIKYIYFSNTGEKEAAEKLLQDLKKPNNFARALDFYLRNN